MKKYVSAVYVGTWVIGLASALGLVSPVLAQTSDRTSSALEEIIVTAQKRTERGQDVPITISVITADAALRAGATTTSDIPSLVPGLTITRQTANPTIFIRGVGTQNVSTGAEGSNAVYLDGFYNPSLGGALFALNSIDRIEVLKGPQGTLFGRNATGGAVNVITRNPSHTPAVSASLGYGNYDTVDASFYGTSGFTETLAGDIAVSEHHMGRGFGINLATGKDVNYLAEFAVRTKFLFTPDSQLNITFAADYDRTNSTLGISLQPQPGAFTPIVKETYTGNYYNVRENLQPWRFQDSWGLQLRASYDLAAAQLVSMTGYHAFKQDFHLDQEASSLPLVDAYLFSNTWGFTQEFQLQSLDTSRIKWIVGAFYLKAKAGSDPLALKGLAFAKAGGSDTRDGRIGTESIAGYAQATVPVGDSSDLTAGVRYTDDKKDLTFVESFGTGVVIVSPIKKKSWGAVTWRLAASHHFTEDVMAYASVSRGFKSGEFGIFSAGPPPVNPETLTALEIGLKTEFFQRRMRANASFFHYDYKDIQLNKIVVGGQTLLNAAAAKVDGLDFDFKAVPVTHLTVGVGTSVLFKHEYSKFLNAPGEVHNAAGSNSSITIPDASGNTMIQSPDATANFNIGYEIPLPRGILEANGVYAYNSGFFWEPDNRLKQKAYGLLSAQLAWSLPETHYKVRLWGKNLTGEQYAAYVNTSIEDELAAAPPRTYGVSFDAKF